jgi:hypothetical protein
MCKLNGSLRETEMKNVFPSPRLPVEGQFFHVYISVEEQASTFTSPDERIPYRIGDQVLVDISTWRSVSSPCRWAWCPGRSWKHTWSSGSAGPPALGDTVAAMDTFVVMAREQTIGMVGKRIRGSVGGLEHGDHIWYEATDGWEEYSTRLFNSNCLHTEKRLKKTKHDAGAELH